MKYLNKKKVQVLFRLFIIALFGLFAVNTKALNNTETFTTHYYSDGSRTFEIGDYNGTCCQAGVDATGGQETATGTAKITKWANTTNPAKIAYYVSYVGKCTSSIAGSSANNKYWYNNRTCRPTKFDDLGLLDKFQISLLAENLVQLAVQGESTWRTAAADKLSYSSSYINYVVSTYNDIMAKYNNGQLSVPSSFELYIGDPTDGKQNFAVWRLAPYSGSKTYATDTPSGANHAIVKPGDEIKYQIKWQGGSGTMTITDTLSKGLTYVAGSSSLGDPTISPQTDGRTVLKWTTTQESGTLTYKVKVSLDICKLGIDQVKNHAVMTEGGTSHTLGELDNPIPSKCYAPDNTSGNDNAPVKVGDVIKYEITLPNIKNEEVTIIVKDVLSKGLSYNIDAGVSDGTLVKASYSKTIGMPEPTTLNFEIKVPAKKTAKLTYSATVNKHAVQIVNNNVDVQYGNDPLIHLDELENPIPQKTYSEDTKAGMNGAEVKKGDVITYSIKYANAKDEKQTITITDTLSKGLKYKKGTAKINGKATEPDSIKKGSDGITTLTWKTELAAGEKAELVYGAKVTGETTMVQNNAYIQYGNDPAIHLNELKNPLVNNPSIIIPDTGSNVAIIGIVLGIALISGGGYLIYKKYKKA